MLDINSVDVSFGGNPFLIFLVIAVLAIYSIYIYRYTIPVVSVFLKSLLTVSRIIAIVLILFLIFDPLVSIERINKQDPINYIFIDNSKSIVQKDSTEKHIKVKELLSSLNQSNIKIIEFSDNTNEIDNLDTLQFKGSSSNFENVADYIQNSEENVITASIISDGIITSGSNPVEDFAKLNIPVFTIGIGDSEIQKDIEVKKIESNEYIYAGAESEISTTIINKEFPGKQITVKLFVDNSIEEQKQIALNNFGINEIEFDYVFNSPGEKSIRIEADRDPEEVNINNNFRTKTITVLNNKLNILLIAGSPSADFSFVKKSLSQDKNLNVNSIVQLTEDRFTNNNINEKIESADIIFLIGFPNKNTSSTFFENTWRKITADSKPFLFLLSHRTNLETLKFAEKELSFLIESSRSESSLFQPEISDIASGLLKHNNSNFINNWNNLPPVLVNVLNFSAKPESKIISKAKDGNRQVEFPLILTRVVSNKRSIAILAADIWKWKLQRTKIDLFDSFFSNSVKWLNTNSNQKQFIVKTNKQTFFQGENIEFEAQVYDDTFAPLNNADIKIEINNDEESNEIVLINSGDGRYRGVFKGNPGEFEFSAQAKIGETTIGNSNGKFTVENVEIEYLNTQMDLNFLYSLSENTNGKHFNIDESSQLQNEITKLSKNKIKQTVINSEFNLRLNKWLLFLIIGLFSLEWFLRKRAGML